MKINDILKESDDSQRMTPNWAKYVLDQLYNSNGAVTMTDLFDEGIPGLHAMFMATAEEFGLNTDDEFQDVEHEVILKLEDIVKGGHGLDEGEVEMPTGQATGIDSQTDTPPSRSFSIKVVGTFKLPGRNMEAQQLFEALQSILPRDYPYVTWNNQMGSPQRRVIDDINNDGFSIIKQGINSQDVAETIASKFEAKGIPAEVIDGGIYEEQGLEEAYDPAQASKYISAAAKAAAILFNATRGWNQDFRSELENQYGFDPDSPGKEFSDTKAKDLIKWLKSKGCELSYDPRSPIDFSLSMPDQTEPYEFNILDMIQNGEVNESSAVPPVDPASAQPAAAPTEYTPTVGEEILWRPRFAKMVPVPVTVVAVAPGKLKIKLQSPRMIQNYGKDTIVVDLDKSDVTPKQGIAEADRLPRPDNWKAPAPAPRPRPAPQKQMEVGDVVGFTPQTHDYKSSGKVFKAEILEIGGRVGRGGLLLKLLNPEDIAANGGNPTMKVSSMISKIQNPYVEPAQPGPVSQNDIPGQNISEVSTINGRVQDPEELVWKLSSMSHDAAVAKYGANNVRRGPKLRNGDSSTEVRVPLGEGKKKPEADYGDDYQDMVARVKKLAGLGPLKTVYDPAKRVYRNVPTAQQPKK